MSQTKYKQLHLYSDADHKPPSATVEPPPPETNRITGLIARQAAQVRSMRLNWIARAAETTYRREGGSNE